MATIKDVARIAGVSTSTVSRVLNGRSASDETAARVMAAVREVDYRASTSARGLVQRSANTVGVIVADISNPPISQMFHGIADRLHRAGFTTMLGNSESDPATELELAHMFAVQRASGIIYTGPGIFDALCEALNAFPAPVVVAAQSHPNLRHPVVRFDNYRASYAVTQHIIASGHRALAFISGPLTDPEAGAARHRGYLDALESHGLTTGPSRIEHADFSIGGGYAAMARILKRSQRLPTVVYAAADLVAIGAMKRLQDAGIRVPEEVSVFGFDNIPVGAHLIPSLTTVELDFHELGEVSADALLRIIERRGTQLEQVVFRHRIVKRESFQPR